MKNSYKSVSDFGLTEMSLSNHPLTYCIGNTLDQRFLHGGNPDLYGSNSRQCQNFMSDYCASGWDNFCESESQNQERSLVSQNHNAGELLIANTAARKYLINMHNAVEKLEPFDPTVANSPMIRYWVNDCGGNKIPEYAVDPLTIDNDILMDKILANPKIALHILINIYNTMKRHGTLSGLKTTKLGTFYNSHQYFKEKGGV
jgi:hypothetical protein